MKIKFTSYVTRKIYRYLITLNSRVTQLENFNFIKNSELHNTNILFKKKNPSYYFNTYTTIYLTIYFTLLKAGKNIVEEMFLERPLALVIDWE